MAASQKYTRLWKTSFHSQCEDPVLGHKHGVVLAQPELAWDWTGHT